MDWCQKWLSSSKCCARRYPQILWTAFGFYELLTMPVEPSQSSCHLQLNHEPNFSTLQEFCGYFFWWYHCQFKSWSILSLFCRIRESTSCLLMAQKWLFHVRVSFLGVYSVHGQGLDGSRQDKGYFRVAIIEKGAWDVELTWIMLISPLSCYGLPWL